MTRSLSIVVPTYLEADNIEPLLEAIESELTGLDYEVLIVDDNSPDQIIEVVERLSASHPWLRLLQPPGREKDLSRSVIDGIAAASADQVLVMDADLSHSPVTIPVMVKALAENPRAFVLGSRYIAGGSFDRDWSLWRFLNSYLATVLARPLVRCSDPMSGFFLLDRRQVNLEQLNPVGYKIGLELMVRGDFDAVIEVPINFQDRTIGESKMNLPQQLKYIRHLRRLFLYRFKGWAEFIHYGAVGASGFVIDLFFYFLFQLAGIHHQLARGLSFWPAVSWNWFLNRQTTFGERRRRPRTRQWLEFVGMSLVGFSVNWGSYVLLTSQVAFFDTYRILALVLGIGLGSVFNFAAATLFVYSEKRS